MSGQSPWLDISIFRLTRLRVLALSGLTLATAIAVSVSQFAGADGLLLPSGANLGGDFLAFYAAGAAARAGDAAAIYDPVQFNALLSGLGPESDGAGGGLTWQYPPSYFLFLVPFALLAYTPAYALWTAGTAAAFAATMHAAGLRGVVLFVIIASAPMFYAAITGQNGFLTASLIAVAAFYPDKRPILAGLAAALLTVKPQLGLLLPIAYLAGGCWRAFFTAAAGTLALAALSVAAFGVEIWGAFFDSMLSTSDHLTSGRMPLYKMATPFAGASLAGFSAEAAAGFYVVCAVAAAACVTLVWRKTKDADLRAAALTACVFFASPYGFYYETIILALPAGLIAKRAMERGWLKGEQAGLVLAFVLPLTGISSSLLLVVLIAALVLRRIAHEQPHVFAMVKSGLNRPPGLHGGA